MKLMSMKVLAAISDLGSIPSSSTRGQDKVRAALFAKLLDLLIGLSLGGAATVSTGSLVGTGGIQEGDFLAGLTVKAMQVGRLRDALRTARTINAKAQPLTMAAAA